MACTTTTTTLSCGHVLTSHSHTCAPSLRPSCKPQILKRYLHDTCAQCDPDYQRRIARATYERAHANLMTVYRVAMRIGDEETVRALEEEDARLLRECKEKILMAGLTRQGDDVALPAYEP